MAKDKVPEYTQKGTVKQTAVLPSKIKKNFKSVIDLGNHWVKAYVEGYELLRESSWYASCTIPTKGKIPGHVKYISGGREDLKDKCWLIGQQAVRSGSSDLMRLVEDYMGKSTLWLEFYFGILAHLPQINSEMVLDVIATCNDVARHEETIRANEGQHRVELAGIPCTITIKISQVLPEGRAALKTQKLTDAVNICDIGGGNISISRFYNSEPVGNTIVKDFGAEYLIEGLARNSEFKKLIKQAPDKDLICRSLENGYKQIKDSDAKRFVLYYGNSNIDFLAPYKVELQDFINCRLREVIKELESLLLKGEQVLIIGGGSKLPLLSAALKQKGFVISGNGAFDNVLGLVEESQWQLTK